MLKKMLSLMLVAMMLTFAVPVWANEAVEIDNDPLGMEELRVWSEECLSRAAQERSLSPIAETEDGYQVVYDFATLYLTTPVITDETAVKAIEITSSMLEAPHGTYVGMTVREVLDSYYNENNDLLGTDTAAVLYLNTTERGLNYGCVQREGQQVLLVEYAACELAQSGAEGYGNAGITYVMEDDVVAAIRVYGLEERISEEELYARDAEMELLMGADSYSQARSSDDGAELEAFGAQDLVFSGIDFQHMDSAEAISVLGAMKAESWIPNDGGGYIHVMTFADCEVTALCDENKSNAQVEMITVFSSGMEGPRHTRIGDSMISVRNRFRHGEGQLADGGNVETLYGQPYTAPYGTAEYGLDGVNIMRYAHQAENGATIMLIFTFEQYALSDIMLCVTE